MLKWGKFFFSRGPRSRNFSYLKNKRQFILIVYRKIFFFLSLILKNTPCYNQRLFISAILTYLELIFHLRKSRWLIWSNRNLKPQWNSDILGKDAGYFTEKFFLFKVYFTPLCQSKSVPRFVNKEITKCEAFLKFKKMYV